MTRAGSPAPRERDLEVKARLREAMLGLVCELSYRSTTIEAICARAGVGEEDFARVYGSKEGAFLEIYAEEAARFIAVTQRAYDGEEGWRDALRAAAYAGAHWVQSHPRESRFCVLEVLRAGETARLRRERTLRHFIDLVDRGRQELDDPDSVSPLFAAAIVGAIAEMLIRRLAEGEEPSRAEDLVPELMYVAVRPYTDREEAEKELLLPPPPPV
jgi:AcrR family transcriptional regulator